MVEMETFDHIEERLRAIEGGGDYAFADMAELCLTRLGLLVLNVYGSGVIDILIESV